MKILFPVVRSTDVSVRFAPLVKWVAGKGQAKIHVIRVEPLLDTLNRVNEGEKWVQWFLKECFSDYPVDKSLVVAGDPSHEILKYVENELIDLVIIGTHGRKGLDRVLVGSVASSLVGDCPVPVLTVNPYRKRDSGGLPI